MYDFWETVASNSLVVVVFATWVTLLGRIWKNPAVLHFLWVLVLLKLVTPPLVTVHIPWFGNEPPLMEGERYVTQVEVQPPPVVISGEGEKTSSVAAFSQEEPKVSQQATVPYRATVPVADAPPVAPRQEFPWQFLLAGTWGVGIALLVSCHVHRIWRFRILLRSALEPCPSMLRMAEGIGRRLGLKRVPEIALLPVRLSPLVWSLTGRPRIFLPVGLFGRLEQDAQEAILAHELAHVRRKDHWVRWLELVVTTVFWWHPVSWWASRQLRELEELCCDELAMATVRHTPRTYAAALLDTLDFLSERPIAVPLVATAATSSASLARRLRMLKNYQSARRLTVARVFLLLALGAVPMTVAFAADRRPASVGGDAERAESSVQGAEEDGGADQVAGRPVSAADIGEETKEAPAEPERKAADPNARATDPGASESQPARSRLSLLGSLWKAALGGGESSADRYLLPPDNVEELADFVRHVQRYQPRTLKGDYEHRQRSAAAIRQAAQRIVELEADQESPAFRTAEAALLRDRVRALPGALPAEQRATLAKVEQYVEKTITAGRTTTALDLAELATQTLQNAGQYRLASETSRSLGGLFGKLARKAGGMRAQFLRANADWLQEKAREFRPSDTKAVAVPAERLVSLDIQPVANCSTDDLSGPGVFEGNGLAELPRGEQTLRGVRFNVGDRLVILGGKKTPWLPKKVEGIQVGRRLARLHALYAAQFAMPPHILNDGELIGQYTLHYEDGSSASLPIIFGRHVRDWWNNDSGKPVTESEVVWTGHNRVSAWNNYPLRLYLGSWENPHPEKMVTTLAFESTDTDAGPFCVGLTVEEVGKP